MTQGKVPSGLSYPVLYQTRGLAPVIALTLLRTFGVMSVITSVAWTAPCRSLPSDVASRVGAQMNPSVLAAY
jgi:hypothetical protein